jgi:hypothetical protein
LLFASHIAGLLDANQLITPVRTNGYEIVECLSPLGREGRVAVAALKRAAWQPSPSVTPTTLEGLSHPMEIDLTGEFIAMADRHPDPTIRSEALLWALARAFERNSMSAELLRICRRSLAEAELACGLIENPGRNGPYGRLSTGQSLPKAIRPSTAIGLLRHLLGSPDGAVQSAAIRCVSSRFAAEFEPDLESMWRRGISAECTAAFAAALAEYRGIYGWEWRRWDWVWC